MTALKEWPREARVQLMLDSVEHWGEVAQVDMLTEELAECILAVQKFFKRKNCIENLENVAEEFADVILMLEEIGLVLDQRSDLVPLGQFSKMVREQLFYKLDRTEARLEASRSR